MRGRRAASKEEKSPTAASASPATAAASTVSSSPADVERPKAKPSKASPSQQKNGAPPASAATDAVLGATVKTEVAVAPETKVVGEATATEASSIGNMPSTVFVKSAQALAPASQPDIVAAMGVSGNPMQNVNDLVAASIHNFQMSQRFHPSSAGHAGNTLYPGNPNQLMTGIVPGNQQPAPVYAMTDGVGYNMNLQPQQIPLQQHPPQQHIQPQQVPTSYQYPAGYSMQQSMPVMPNYAVPTNFPTSSHMQMQMQMSMPMPVSPAVPNAILWNHFAEI